MKHYLAYLLLLILPFTILSCGGSSGGDDQGTEQVADTGDGKMSPETGSSRQIYTFTDDSSLTPNVAFATDNEMVIVLGPDVEGDEMPLKSMILQKDGVGSLLVEFSANGMPSAFITRDGTVKINRYSYAEGKWFIHFSVNQAGSVTDHAVELPQSFGEYVSNLDSWIRNGGEAVNQLTVFSKQNQSGTLKDSIATIIEITAIGVEMGTCAASTIFAPPTIFLACQSAVVNIVDFIKNGQLTITPTTIDYANCLISVGEDGFRAGDPVCLVSTGLRSAAALVRDDTPDTSEMENLADTSMENDRYIGEDPIIEDFPTPLLSAPQVAITSPQWLASFSSDQPIFMEIAASESVSKIDFEIRSIETGAVVRSGDSEREPSGNFSITLPAGSFTKGRYVITVSASDGKFTTKDYGSFIITNISWRGTLRITEEVYISGDDQGIGKRACQLAFSIISRSEFTPVVYDISLPSIFDTTSMRVDSTFGGSNNWPYCTQAPIKINNKNFTYVAITPSWDRGDIVLPRLENSFDFTINERSNSAVSGTMTATATVYDTIKGWHKGSCKAEFELNKSETQAFNECDVSAEHNICQPGSELCEWSNP